jgi:hypothetical protein
MVLLEELVEEVLLRLPPADPASLVRAAIVCKPWCRIISDRRFRRRFSEFHRSPPMLGLLCNFRDQDGDYVSRLLPTSSACPLRADHNWRALDARHGRVLLSLLLGLYLSVWDPIMDGWHQLPPVPDVW